MEMEEPNLVIQFVDWTTTSSIARYHDLLILSVFLPVFCFYFLNLPHQLIQIICSFFLNQLHIRKSVPSAPPA
jgi:hypothetical protein